MANLSNINNKFLVTTGGNVGIGVTGPTAKLHIGVSSANDDTFHIFNGSVRTHLLGSESSNGVIYLRSSANSNKVRINTSGDSYFNGGNVGIGNTSPSDFLSWQKQLVVGSGSADVGITIYHGSGSGNQGAIVFADGNTGTDRYRGSISYNGADEMKFFTSTIERMRIDSSGVVKISNTGDAILTITSGTTNTAKINLGDSSNDDAGIIAYTNDAGGSDNMAFTVATSERMRITSGGNVGIGTTNPSDANLVVKKDGVNTGITNVLMNASFSEGGGVLKGLSIGYRTDETTAVLAPRTATGNLAFYSYDGAWSESMRITNSGNVGIGTASPDSKLDVKGASATPADGNQILSITNTTGGTQLNLGTAENSYGWIEAREGATLRNLLLNPNGGNVGIGTVSPTQKLEVHSTIKIGESGVTGGRLISGDSMIFQIDSDNNSNTSSYRFRTNGTADDGTELMRIQENGSVGIGTTTPSEKLHIASSAASNLVAKIEQDNASYESWFEANSQNGGLFRAGISTNANNFAFFNTDQASYRWFGAGGGSPMTLTNGNLGIGTTSPASVLHIKDNTAGPTQLSIQSNDFTRAEEINFLNPSTSAISGQIKYYTNPTVEYMSFSTSNNSATVERMRITGSGNVGIGTTSPDYTLHLLKSSGDTEMYINGQSGQSSLRMGLDARNWQIKTAAAPYLWSLNYVGTDFQTPNIITATVGGNVGIGTTSPSKPLQIGGSAPWIRLQENSASSKRLDLWVDNGVGYIGANQSAQELAFQTDSSDRINILNNGNVGIRNTSPTNTLGINSTSINTNERIINLYTGTTGPGKYVSIGAQYSNSNALSNSEIRFGNEVQSSSPSFLAFATGSSSTPTERMRITSAGNVGIGTATPSARLSLGDQTGQSFYVYEGSGASNVRAGLGIDMSGSSRELSIFCSSSTGFSNGNISFGYRLESNSAYQERMRLTSGGNLGIGTTSPGAKLEVAGNVIITGGYTDQNGVRTFKRGGKMYNNTTYSFDITVDDDTGTGTVHHITAMMTHFSTTYGCVLDCYAYTRGTAVNVQTDLLNQSNAAAGGWTVSKTSATTLRLTKSAGTYTGLGNYQFVVVTSTP